ncbi:11368_t:CDS:1, partial [Gigaspora margarita]
PRKATKSIYQYKIYNIYDGSNNNFYDSKYRKEKANKPKDNKFQSQEPKNQNM